MCGIFCSATCSGCSAIDSKQLDDISADCINLLSRRGPDSMSETNVNLSGGIACRMVGSVLWMQGDAPVSQPITDQLGNVLLWNGEVFNQPWACRVGASDSLLLSEALSAACHADQLLAVLASVRGPYAFVYLQAETRRLWIARDRIGRHSLLAAILDPGRVVIASVGTKRIGFKEVPNAGVFCIHLADGLRTTLHPWSDRDPTDVSFTDLFPSLSVSATTIPSPLEPPSKPPPHPPADFSAMMDQSQAVTIPSPMEPPSKPPPHPPADFSAMMDQSQAVTIPSPMEPPSKPLPHPSADFSAMMDQSQAVTIPSPMEPPSKPLPHPSADFSAMMDQSQATNSHESLDRLSQHATINLQVRRLLDILSNSVRVRVETQPNVCRECVSSLVDDPALVCRHAKIGILFSGGLDSAVLALLADGFVSRGEPIDLINVAFQRPAKPNAGARNQKNGARSRGAAGVEAVVVNYDVPDRKTGRQTLEELKVVRPDRCWQFVEVNVPQEELVAQRDSRISDLISPLDSVLDDSLGCALWFAARAQGQVGDLPYTSTARVLLLGMGADEQMGGYARHRTTLARDGWGGLHDQLASDLDRIASRNLGRDDRVTADSGRQARMPYLDERVVSLLNGLSPWQKCYPVASLPPGVGDKYILRLAARSLGLANASVLPKRALQFGSRIANSREKGDDKCDRL